MQPHALAMGVSSVLILRVLLVCAFPLLFSSRCSGGVCQEKLTISLEAKRKDEKVNELIEKQAAEAAAAAAGSQPPPVARAVSRTRSRR